MNRKVTLALVLAGCMLLGTTTPAISQSTTTESASETATTDEKTDSQKDKKESEAGPDNDEFIPTEDISEDFAVSFPVDI